jgi:hypothetical protein
VAGPCAERRSGGEVETGRISRCSEIVMQRGKGRREMKFEGMKEIRDRMTYLGVVGMC